MNPWPPFRLADSPLAEGAWLIEASAGTGKTFTIAGLFLRLIVERELSVREILVVTFTEAATEELRDRIRRTLAEAAAVLAGATAVNPAVPLILARCATPAATICDRLERALRAFDEAPIFTIHSFCQRALKDRAFESGALFDTELLTDDSELLQQVADDFWRRRFYAAGALVVNVLLKHNHSPERLAETLRLHSRHPELRVISAVDGRAPAELAGELDAAFDAAGKLWRAQRDEIRAVFTSGWAKGDHAKPALVAASFADLDRCFGNAGPTPDTLASLKFFTPAVLEENTRAKADTPSHAFFDRCAAVLAAEDNFLVGLELEFLSFARAELPRRKHELKAQSFDDLLTRLRDALRGDRGPALATELRRKYRAALIDEFQDTDPVQWEIFRSIFAPRDAAKPAPQSAIATFLYLIGDPKQAIYGFRGADIFTYLDAARGVAPGHGFTLDRNWRSESGLVAAVNTLFGSRPNPFAFDEIHFQPVTAAGRADAEPLAENGIAQPPLRLWLAEREQDQQNISKEVAEQTLPPLVVAEIVRLLNGGTRLGDRRLAPRDIAVLVPENRQAALMQEALRRAGVPSVLHTEESVFASREARELERVLAALAQPGHERALRAALTTDLLGLNGTALDALGRDEAGWESRLERSRTLHALWLERGFMPMFRQWLHAEDVRVRLLAFDDGERRLTNLLHLAEVLHAAAHERRLGAGALVRWLAEQVSSGDRARDEHQLRLERDDEAVRLVTIHKSKGLEYPVVFLPFSWKSSDLKRGGEEQVFFHERGGDDGVSHYVRDLGSAHFDEHRQLAFHEKLAENLRQLYVALTRARNRCYFVWGAFRGAETSAGAWLLHQPPVTLPERRAPARHGETIELAGQELGAPAQDLKAAMTAHFKSLNDAAMQADLERLAETAQTHALPASPLIQVEPLPQPTSARYVPATPSETRLTPRRFTRSIPTDWRITSFSGLIADRSDERPDRDAEPRTVAPDPAPAAGIFAFPRGTQAGTCLHKIFEELDFTRAGDDAFLCPLIEAQLRLHGFPPVELAPAVIGAMRQTLAVPLDAARPDFTLGRVANAERINELEFCLPVHELTPALLQAGLAAAGDDVAARLGALDFKPAGGFIRGFIDLVFRFEDRFYIVDWKSNWLGNRAEDYGASALRAEMVRKFYVLQYHLYTVALHEYLKLRRPGYEYETHFGGVCYVFLRGVDPTRPELGVFRDRPAAEMITKLSQSLSGRNEAAR